jgi:hypothetical protein
MNIEARALPMTNQQILAALSTGQVQLALISWLTPEERNTWTGQFGMENVIDLYVLPISYLALPGLTITQTPSGWPLASH